MAVQMAALWAVQTAARTVAQKGLQWDVHLAGHSAAQSAV